MLPRAPEAKEVVTWETLPKYFLDPTFGRSAVIHWDSGTFFTTTEDLTGIAFVTENSPSVTDRVAPAHSPPAATLTPSGIWTTTFSYLA